ncbi:MAG: TetR/AcrR family transcriptional regulator [Aeromicrobium sp.]
MEKARTARQRAREEITAEILGAARIRLATTGPGALSLRAVARDVGMVSSAVYRYFPSRDELLTALIVEAYDDLGAAAESADDTVTDRDDARARWMTTCRAVRSWAVTRPHEYALLFGSPVNDYAAPRDTVAPASRVILRLLEIVEATRRSGAAGPPPPDSVSPGFGDSVQDALASVEELTGVEADLPVELVGRTLLAWSAIFGVISFELWGHFLGSVNDPETYFEGVAARLWHDLGGV